MKNKDFISENEKAKERIFNNEIENTINKLKALKKYYPIYWDSDYQSAINTLKKKLELK